MAPHSRFALFTFDPSGLSDPVSIVPQGPWVETLDDKTCNRIAGLLDQASSKLALTDLTLAGGLSVEIVTLIEQAPPGIAVVGARVGASLNAARPKPVTLDLTMPPFEVGNLVQTLRGSANDAGKRRKAQWMKAAA